MKLLKEYESVASIPKDESPLPLGSRAEVHTAVMDSFPGTDWSDPEWGIFDSEFGSIEFNLGKDEPAMGMMLHMRASNEIVQPILELCQHQRWKAYDCSTGEFLEKGPHAGIEGWRAYRDRVLAQFEEKE